jgi:Ser/Thr protein kinase RdoA (MazF antagonist)
LNDTYTVQAGASTYYLRVYRHGWRRKSEIDAEVDMLAYLASQGQPVSRPVPRKDGAYLNRIAATEGTRYAVVFTEAVGQVPRFDLADCSQYGEIVAKIHQSLDQRREDTRRFHLDLTHLVDRPLEHIEPFLAHRKEVFAYLKHVGDGLKSDIEGLLPRDKPEYGCCHGDHHGGDNVHRDQQGRMVVFDFDCYGYGWRAYDLAVFRCHMAGDFGVDRGGRAKLERRWNAFLDGYCGVRALTDSELKATELFVPIRRIWWLGLHTSQTVQVFGDSFLTDDWFDRYVGLIRQSVTDSDHPYI